MPYIDETSAAPAPTLPRPWWRLHKSTPAVVAIALALAALWNVSGFIRFQGPPYALWEAHDGWEWHNGWPCTYLRRSLGTNPDGSLYKPWALHEQVTEFDAWALAANVAVVACLTAVLAALLERRRRRRRGRRWQITLRQLALSFVVLAALMAWWVAVLKAHHREEAAIVKILTTSSAVVRIETGMPHCLRSLFTDRYQFFETETIRADFLPFDRARSCTLRHLWHLPAAAFDLSPLSELPDLTYLELSPADHLRDDDLRLVGDLRRLETLKCSQARLLTDAGFSHLASLTSLRKLFLHDLEITNEGLKHLRRLTAIEELLLVGTQIDDAGLQQIAGMHELERLILQDSRVTDAGLLHLRALPKLRYLDVLSTDVTPAGIDELRRALPDLKVAFDDPAATPP